MGKPAMTSQFARRLPGQTRQTWERRLDFWFSALRTYQDEAIDLLRTGKDVRNVLRVLNARHHLTKRSIRRADMRLIDREGQAHLLGSRRSDLESSRMSLGWIATNQAWLP